MLFGGAAALQISEGQGGLELFDVFDLTPKVVRFVRRTWGTSTGRFTLSASHARNILNRIRSRQVEMLQLLSPGDMLPGKISAKAHAPSLRTANLTTTALMIWYAPPAVLRPVNHVSSSDKRACARNKLLHSHQRTSAMTPSNHRRNVRSTISTRFIARRAA